MPHCSRALTSHGKAFHVLVFSARIVTNDQENTATQFLT